MKHRLCGSIVLALGALLGTARAGDAKPVFDRIDADLGPYLDHRDPFSFAMKIQSVTADEYTFWRGTKGLFFQWCKAHCADWLADPKSQVVSHGDLHFGNLGTYATAWGETAFGLVDFDESAKLPYQIELLQGAITIDLLAKQNDIELDAAARRAAFDLMFDTYAAALNSGQTATVLVRKQPLVHNLRSKRVDYSDDIEKYVKGGHFRLRIGKMPSNVLLPVDAARWPAFADAIAGGAGHDVRLAALLKSTDPATLLGQIRDVARRVRLGSSGSQGLEKYLVLLKQPFKEYPGDAILYLKREIPSAAERCGATALRMQSPGERYVQDMAALTDPPALLSSWATVDEKSFWLSLKEPWSDDIDYESIQNPAALRQAIVIWASAAGAAHAHAGFRINENAIAPNVRTQILDRADAYVAQCDTDFESLHHDPRVAACSQQVEAAIEALRR